MKKIQSSQPTFIPMLGRIKAGPATQDASFDEDPVSLDQYLVQHPGYTYLLRVSGDSMIDEGIKQGDLVILDKKREPKNHDIVAALIDNEWTLKYFMNDQGEVYLKAANPKYPPLHPKESLSIGGVVVSVIKKYY
ncbi:MAG: LexA family transcriptional regulator [Patescibacteria group bacterium]